MLELESRYRLYNCQRCHGQVRICSRCDRGQVYCRSGCAQMARQASVRRAGRRYQQSRRGAHRHAARQAAYRQRQREKVTHHGFPPSRGSATVPLAMAREARRSIKREDGHREDVVQSSSAGRHTDPRGTVRCDACGGVCLPFARRSYG